MSKIQVLDQITIDKIAAGEVIERPASVVKELAENAIDAGATAVTVEIKEGGITFMRIADNGSELIKKMSVLHFYAILQVRSEVQRILHTFHLLVSVAKHFPVLQRSHR